jgi:hypothetical protein
MVSTPDVDLQWWAAGERAWSNDRLRAGTWTRGLKGAGCMVGEKKSNVTGTIDGDDRWEHMQAARSGGANGRRQWGRVDWAPATATANPEAPCRHLSAKRAERGVSATGRAERATAAAASGVAAALPETSPWKLLVDARPVCGQARRREQAAQDGAIRMHAAEPLRW